MSAAAVGVESVLKRTALTTLSSSALRRALVAACALAFLLAGFAHNIQHFDTRTVPLSWQTTIGPSDDSPDPSKQASMAIEHCHGAMPVVASWMPPALVSKEMPLAIVDATILDPPSTVVPPPILPV